MWASEGFLTNIGEIIAGRARGRPESIIPLMARPAWMSSVVGVNLGKHGICNFFLSIDFGCKRTVFTNSRKRGGEVLWNSLNEAGKSIMNSPATYQLNPEELYDLGTEVPETTLLLDGGFSIRHLPETSEQIRLHEEGMNTPSLIRCGDHALNSAAVAACPDIGVRESLQEVGIIGITFTALKLLEKEIPNYMDGNSAPS